MEEVRFLEPEEYKRLGEIPEPDRVILDPDNSLVAVAIDGGNGIVGRLVGISLPHVECAWIDPKHRSGFLLFRMEEIMIRRLKSHGAKLALAIAVDETMENYVKRLGYEKLGTAWKKEI